MTEVTVVLSEPRLLSRAVHCTPFEPCEVRSDFGVMVFRVCCDPAVLFNALADSGAGNFEAMYGAPDSP